MISWDEIDLDLYSSYAGLLALAVASIYAGSFGSLPNPKPHGRPSDESEPAEEVTERMSSEDAWIFPIVGSLMLFGLYIIVKYFGKEWINWLLGWYFALVGVGSVWKSSISLTRYVLGNTRWKKFDKLTVSCRKANQLIFSVSCRTPSLFLLPLGTIPSILYTLLSGCRRSVLLTDILSLSFSHTALSFLKIDSFKTGCIFLSGLFVYDIWWVFGTDVMVSVADSLDVPIKLLWPKSIFFSHGQGFTTLGLGDVVVPGTFIALALRYDYHRFSTASGEKSFVKPYFYATLIGYVAGLVSTIIALNVSGHSQPALLYLSPACMLSFFITAKVRGEMKDAWVWRDDPAKLSEGSSGKKRN